MPYKCSGLQCWYEGKLRLCSLRPWLWWGDFGAERRLVELEVGEVKGDLKAKGSIKGARAGWVWTRKSWCGEGKEGMGFVKLCMFKDF